MRFFYLLFCVLQALSAAEPTQAGRKIDIALASDFKAQPADVKAVLHSTAEAIWQHCPHTEWRVPGFEVYHSPDYPIAVFDHRANGRIAIGLTTQGSYWSQFAFQFSHEFCHALAGHSNDWRKPWIRVKKANMWLEESLCETASLFALRSMGQSWKTKAPYPNWTDYHKSLTQYAQDRLDEAGKGLPPGKTFVNWLRENEPSMRKNSVIREKNTIVARALLPLFEKNPKGWEAVAYLNLGARRDPNLTLAQHLTDWRAASPAEQRAFITELAKVLGVTL